MKKTKVLYTIGFAQKKAEEFFNILIDNRIQRLIDIRNSNTNIYAGFTIKANLAFFLKELCGIEYMENKLFAPTKEIRNRYKADQDWNGYQNDYLALLEERNAIQSVNAETADNAVLLCTEPTADFCHRRLAAEYIARHIRGLRIVHL